MPIVRRHIRTLSGVAVLKVEALQGRRPAQSRTVMATVRTQLDAGCNRVVPIPRGDDI